MKFLISGIFRLYSVMLEIMSTPSFTILKTKMIWRNLCLATNLNFVVGNNKVFKWSRVEEQAIIHRVPQHVPLDPRCFFYYQKKKNYVYQTVF